MMGFFRKWLRGHTPEPRVETLILTPKAVTNTWEQQAKRRKAEIEAEEQAQAYAACGEHWLSLVARIEEHVAEGKFALSFTGSDPLYKVFENKYGQSFLVERGLKVDKDFDRYTMRNYLMVRWG